MVKICLGLIGLIVVVWLLCGVVLAVLDAMNPPESPIPGCRRRPR
jgi:cell division septal protein FtsQ